MINIAICEDEKIFSDEFEKKLSSIFYDLNSECRISTFKNGKEFLEADEYFPIVFMDIAMPVMDGLTAAKKYREKYMEYCLIIVSSLHGKLQEGYEAEAFRFVLKEDSKESLKKVIKSALDRLDSGKMIEVYKDNESMPIPVNDIYCISVYGHDSIVFSKYGEYILRKSLTEVENMIQHKNFYRTHKSYYVNMKYIKSFDRRYIYLNNGMKLEISKRKKKEFQHVFSEFIKRTGNQ